MKIKNKLENVILKLEDIQAKKTIQNLMKKLLASFIITTNIFFYMPPIIFAASNDSDDRVPATVPAVANEIISKYVNTNIEEKSNSPTSNGYSSITNYEESGDGWDTITKVDYSNGKTRTYRNYQQWKGSYASNSYWEGDIASDGCGPTSIAIVLTGYGYDVDPGDVVYDMHNNHEEKLDISFLDYLVQPFKTMANIEAKKREFSENSKKEINESLQNARPVIVNYPGHFIVCLGVDSEGKIIYSDPGFSGRETEYGLTVDELVNNCTSNDALGYILITSDSDTTSEEINSNNKNSNNKNENSSNNSSGKGETYNSSKYGYNAIFTSGITGRQFKEYKQSIPGWDSKYNITRRKLFMDFRMWNS